jgi:hypothetical protein
MNMTLVIRVLRAGGDAYPGVHAVFDFHGVREGAMGQHMGGSILFDIELENDSLAAFLGQHAEAQMDGALDFRAGFQPQVDFDPVFTLLRIGFESGHKMGTDNVVSMHFETGHIVAEHMTGLDSGRFQQALDEFGIAHKASWTFGSFAWSQTTQRFSKYWPIR